VVGGYTGTIALRTIVAYIPGQQPRTVARLPQPPRLRAALTHAGRLPVALSDVGAASVSRRIVALGGRDRTGRVHDAILSLTAQP
jgi:hypothetical protein